MDVKSVGRAPWVSHFPDQNTYFWGGSTIAGYGGININLAQYTSPQIEADLKVGHESGDPAQRKAAYDDLVRQLNAAAVNIWTYWTPYSIIADHSVHGLHAAETIAFANYQPKTWFGQLWHG